MPASSGHHHRGRRRAVKASGDEALLPPEGKKRVRPKPKVIGSWVISGESHDRTIVGGPNAIVRFGGERPLSIPKPRSKKKRKEGKGT